MKTIGISIGCIFLLISGNCQSLSLLQKVQAELNQQKGFFGIAYKNLQTGETVLWNEHISFHAASTMKTPVMIEIYKQVAAGHLVLTDSVTVKNSFRSIVDSSLYQLNPNDDSEQSLYGMVGKRIPLSELVYRMIIQSSNLATNMLIEMVDGKKVTQSMRDLGAMDIQVLRGVEDGKAFEKGLNNTTTAYDLMLIFEKMARGEILNKAASEDMIRILLDQRFGELIPALLPKNVKVAHKTGSITGVQHDSGIILLPDGRKYVLVMLSKDLKEVKSAVEAMARVSEIIYQYFMSDKPQ